MINDRFADATTFNSQFVMTFDTSPPILKRLEGTLRADPMVIRCVDSLRLYFVRGVGQGR